MTTPILVTGGTGTLGRLVVPRLRDAGHDIRVLSRSSKSASDGVTLVTGDLATGEGIAAAVAGAEVIVHLAAGFAVTLQFPALTGMRLVAASTAASLIVLVPLVLGISAAGTRKAVEQLVISMSSERQMRTESRRRERI